MSYSSDRLDVNPFEHRQEALPDGRLASGMDNGLPWLGWAANVWLEEMWVHCLKLLGDLKPYSKHAEDDAGGNGEADEDSSGDGEPFDIPHAGDEDKTGMPGEPEGIHHPLKTPFSATHPSL